MVDAAGHAGRASPGSFPDAVSARAGEVESMGMACDLAPVSRSGHLGASSQPGCSSLGSSRRFFQNHFGTETVGPKYRQ